MHAQVLYWNARCPCISGSGFVVLLRTLAGRQIWQIYSLVRDYSVLIASVYWSDTDLSRRISLRHVLLLRSGFY